jgi:hypothetical protein
MGGRERRIATDWMPDLTIWNRFHGDGPWQRLVTARPMTKKEQD